jgi:hypothetical protein
MISILIYLLGCIICVMLWLFVFKKGDDITLSELIIMLLSALLSWIMVSIQLLTIIIDKDFSDKVIIKRKKKDDKYEDIWKQDV